MSERFLMGLDLGGGGLRCLVVNPETLRVVTAYRHWTASPVPEVPMGVEYDAAGTWSVLGDVVREALGRAQVAPEAILGVAATSMRHGSALLDADGRELLLASNRDARGSSRRSSSRRPTAKRSTALPDTGRIRCSPRDAY